MENVGAQGALVEVPAGYFRNFLQPQGIAKPATGDVLAAIAATNAKAAAAAAATKAEAQVGGCREGPRVSRMWAWGLRSGVEPVWPSKHSLHGQQAPPHTSGEYAPNHAHSSLEGVSPSTLQAIVEDVWALSLSPSLGWDSIARPVV